MNERLNDIYKAIVLQAQDCDSCQKTDNIGFSAFDTKSGKRLGKQIQLAWDKEDYLKGLALLRKYKRQATLNAPDCDFYSPEYDKVVESFVNKPYLAYFYVNTYEDKKFIFVTSKYDVDLIERFKEIKGRRWNAVQKVNMFPISQTTLESINDITLSFDGIQFSAQIRELLDRLLISEAC